MFETALVSTGRGSGSSLSFSGSLLLQAALVSVGVVASVWLPVALPDVPELSLAATPRFPRAVKVVRVPQSLQSAASVPTPFRPVYVERYTGTKVAVAGQSVVDFGEAPVVGDQSGDFRGTEVPIGIAVPKVAPPPPPPPAPPVERPAPTRLAVGGQVLAAQILSRPQPVYPVLARQARIEGVVRLHGVISREGRIVALQVLSGHPLLIQAALDAVQQWTYKPTFLNGQPIEVEAPIEVRFVLGR